jgi:hypothetical protein
VNNSQVTQVFCFKSQNFKTKIHLIKLFMSRLTIYRLIYNFFAQHLKQPKTS